MGHEEQWAETREEDTGEQEGERRTETHRELVPLDKITNKRFAVRRKVIEVSLDIGFRRVQGSKPSLHRHAIKISLIQQRLAERTKYSSFRVIKVPH